MKDSTMTPICKTIIAVVTIHLVAAVTGQELDKRGHQGFFGMRGKKFNDDPEQFYKRKPQFFVGVKGKKAHDLFETPDVPQMYYKRAPMGFVGMRGKKEYYFDEDKRAPMGFVGMRGKKDLYADEVKRAMGFVGMRGKKELYSDEEKRAPMGFVGMRGKKEFSNEYFPDSYEYVPKRGSLIGQIDYNSNENNNEFPLLSEIITEYLNKLEHSNSDSVTEVSEPSEQNERSEQDERSEEEHLTNEVEKRAANFNQFYGVRGKKSLQMKRPYDVSFRGKFIGVRGKKDLKNSGAQEIKILVDHNGSFPKRKGSMGFIGMRGKKWTDESSPETASPN